MSKLPITKNGFTEIESELEKLKKVDRPAIIDAISEARDHGDLKENAEYHSARDKQSFIEGRIQELESIIANSNIVDVSTLSGDKVLFGATVKLLDFDDDSETEYQIVGDYEADLDKGRISFNSPIARALIGKNLGDEMTVKTPKAEKDYEIISVKYQ